MKRKNSEWGYVNLTSIQLVPLSKRCWQELNVNSNEVQTIKWN